MKKILPLFLLCGSFAFSQSTFTNGAGNCNTPRGTLFCSAMPTSDGGYFAFYFNGQPSTTFSGGRVSKVGPGGVLDFTYADFSGTYVNGVITGTFNGGNGSTTQIIQIVLSGCYKKVCHYYPQVVSGSTTN